MSSVKFFLGFNGINFEEQKLTLKGGKNGLGERTAAPMGKIIRKDNEQKGKKQKEIRTEEKKRKKGTKKRKKEKGTRQN